MVSPQAFMCSCCKDIYAYENLATIVLSTGSLKLCPDCLASFHKKYGTIPKNCFECEYDTPDCPCNSLSANEVLTRYSDKRHVDCPFERNPDYDSRRIS